MLCSYTARFGYTLVCANKFMNDINSLLNACVNYGHVDNCQCPRATKVGRESSHTLLAVYI